jgi:hypothetical protein
VKNGKKKWNSVKQVSVPLASHFKFSSSLCPSTKEEKEHMSRILYVMQ